MEIRLLTEETISRIAAGEVIERPLNVVKELIENSIDAGSTAITVEIKDGGIRMIRVTDNGCGIERDQIATAFIRHATSKIRDAEDLTRLSSLGFRGEALASIAAVAQVEMITKVRDQVCGTRAVNDHLASYSPDSPVHINLEEIGAPDGTTVIVRNLFDSIPVRKKFLRQPQTEAGYITDLMEKQALSHPRISFHYRVNGQDKLHTTGRGDLREILYRIYGRETAGALLPIHAEDEERGMVLDGFLGKPEISRSSRSFEVFFINGRMLRSKELSAGLEEGYRTDLMQHRFPFAVLHLTMRPQDLDVNVHPSKMEVRFCDRRAVYDFLNESVHAVLHRAELIPKATLNTAKEERAIARKESRLKAEELQKARFPEPFESGRSPRAPLPPALSGGVSAPVRQDRFDQTQDGEVGRKEPHGPSKESASKPADDFLFEDRRPYQTSRTEAAASGSRDPAFGTHAGQENAGGTEGPLSEKSDSSEELLQEKSDGSEEPLQEKSDGSEEPLQEKSDGSEELLQEKSGQLILEGLDPGPREKENGRLLAPDSAEKYKYIGQVFGTYWIIEYEKQILIIDQHAAHEKVNYERMMHRIERDHPAIGSDRSVEEASPEAYLSWDRLPAGSETCRPGEETDAPLYVASQQLLPPIVIRLSGKEESAYLQFKNVFAAMGYEIEEFGGGAYAIRAVPTELFGHAADALLREILEEIMNERISGTPRAIISKVASMSCKAAVKGNTRLSETEARALISELLTLDNPYHCPHGRPTMIVMSQYELDRKFKRIV